MTHKQTYLKLYSSLKDRLERLSADNPIELALLVFCGPIIGGQFINSLLQRQLL